MNKWMGNGMRAAKEAGKRNAELRFQSDMAMQQMRAQLGLNGFGGLLGGQLAQDRTFAICEMEHDLKKWLEDWDK